MRRIFNNVIVKGFQQDEAKVDDPDYLEGRKAYLTQMFKKFGRLDSVFLQKVNSNKPEIRNKLFAFVCYKNPDSAYKAVTEMHGTEPDG